MKSGSNKYLKPAGEPLPPRRERKSVVVILEIPRKTYRSLRPHLDKIIAGHDLTCYVRMDN